MATLYVENVPDDLYRALRKRAKSQRRSLAAEVLVLLELMVDTKNRRAFRARNTSEPEQSKPQPVPSSPGARLRNPGEIRAWLDSLTQFSTKLPPLPKRITREWLYEDHD